MIKIQNFKPQRRTTSICLVANKIFECDPQIELQNANTYNVFCSMAQGLKPS